MEHKCKELPGSGVGVYRAEHFLTGKNWKWCLVVQRLATESDLGENSSCRIERACQEDVAFRVRDGRW